MILAQVELYVRVIDKGSATSAMDARMDGGTKPSKDTVNNVPLDRKKVMIKPAFCMQ